MRLSLTRPAQLQLRAVVHVIRPMQASEIPEGDRTKRNGGYFILFATVEGRRQLVLIDPNEHFLFVFDRHNVGILDELYFGHPLNRWEWSLQEKKENQSWLHWFWQQELCELAPDDALTRVIEFSRRKHGWMWLVGPDAAMLPGNSVAPVQAAVLPALEASAVPTSGPPKTKQMPRTGSVLTGGKAGKNAKTRQVTWAVPLEQVVRQTQERTGAGGDAQ